MKVDWKALVGGIVAAVARPKDAATITQVIIPAAQGIVALIRRGHANPEAPAVTRDEVLAALDAAKRPWLEIEQAARQELDETARG